MKSIVAHSPPSGLRSKAGLRELGYHEGRDIIIDYQYADGRLRQAPMIMMRIDMKSYFDLAILGIDLADVLPQPIDKEPGVRGSCQSRNAAPTCLSFSGLPSPMSDMFLGGMQS